jgi:GntR family transcriptional regulator / MocR family aminotransferase
VPRSSRELEWPITLDRRSDKPLGDQLVDQLRAAILAGQLRPGTLLPSTRSLARTLALSRTTTFNAYERLLSEGYLVAQHGSGTRVSDDVPAFSQAHRLEPVATPRWLHRPPLPAGEVERVPPGAVAFRTGITHMPDSSLARWQSTLRQCAREALPTAYRLPEGDPDFRTEVAAYLGRARGIACTADDIVITGGTMRGMDLLLQATLLPGDLVGIEEPGYPLARQLLLARGLQLIPLPVDGGGLRVADLPTGAHAPRAIYVTPSHQYPLGGRLSIGRRRTLLDWADAHGVLVVEDDYDSEFRFDAPPLPALAALDESMRQVAYLGTFSKVLTPAVRCGYMVVPPVLRERILQLVLWTEFHPSWLVQRILTTFIHEGYLELHIRRMRQHYAYLRAALAQELAPLAPQATLRGLEAGLHSVLELPHDPVPVIQEAWTRGVVVDSLDEYYIGQSTMHGLVLGYGGLDANMLIRGARQLAQILRAVGSG